VTCKTGKLDGGPQHLSSKEERLGRPRSKKSTSNTDGKDRNGAGGETLTSKTGITEGFCEDRDAKMVGTA